MEKWTCTECKNTFSRYRTQVRNPALVFCSVACKGKWQSVNSRGSSNPNYRQAGYSQPAYCSCGNEKDLRSDKCAQCAKRSFSIGTKGEQLSDTDLLDAVKRSTSYQEVAERLKTTRTTATKYLAEMQVDLGHFRPGRGRPIPTDKLFVTGQVQRNGILKSRIIKENLKPLVCECGQGSLWNGKKLVLQLDHINGDSRDNRLENLRFLCPNCHSQTSTFCGKNTKVAMINRDKEVPACSSEKKVFFTSDTH